MAILGEHLSFTTISKDPNPALEVTLLYVRSGRSRGPSSTRTHQHPYWQLEILNRPGAVLETAAGTDTLAAGDVVLLPPHTVHCFTYAPEVTWLTVRYTLAEPEPPQRRIIHADDREVLGHLCPLVRLLYEQASRDPAAKQPALRAALTALILSLHEPTAAPPRDPFLARVEAVMDTAQGKHLTNLEVAAALGYSPNYLASRFKARTGMSLKQTLDQACAEMAARMLAFDDLTISQVAQELGFPDVFSFSRFFLRTRGVRPRDYRRRTRKKAPRCVEVPPAMPARRTQR